MRTEDAFGALLEKLIDVAADKRLGEEERRDLRSKVHQLELTTTQMKRDIERISQDKALIVKNYEKLKAVVPAKLLAEHEKAIDDIPF